MAGALVQSVQLQTTVNGIGQNLHPALTPSAGNALVVYMSCNDASNAALSGNGNTYSFAGSSTPVFGGQTLFIYYVQNCNGGLTTIARTGGDINDIRVEEWSGLATSGGVSGAFSYNPQAGGPGTGSNAVNAGTVTVSSAPSIVMAFACDAAGTANPNSASNSGAINPGTTLAWTGNGAWVDSVPNNVSRFQSLRVLSGGGVIPTWTLTGTKGFSDFFSAAFALPEASGGPPAIPLTGQILM